MARLLRGLLRINENNSRTIVGGFSSFVKSLDNQGYETVGVFQALYFPPNTKSNYNYYFPNKAQRSAKTAKSILSGNLTHEDAIYTIPYKDYLEEKIDSFYYWNHQIHIFYIHILIFQVTPK